MQKFKKRLLSTATAVIMGVTAFASMGTVSAAVQEYDLYVSGLKVTEKNCSDIWNDGKVSYDPETKTLNLKGGTQTYIENRDIKGLTINVASDTTIQPGNSGFSNSLVINNDTTITGNGKLTLISKQHGIKDTNGSLTIKNADIDITAKWAMDGYESTRAVPLTINNSNLDINATATGITGFKGGITLKDCEITTPEKAVMGTGDYVGYVFASDGRTNAQRVVIEPVDQYGIEIDKISVSSRNKSDVTGNGKVSYNPDTKTLTLNGGTYNYINNEEVEGLTINVAADTTVRNDSKNYNYGRTFVLDMNTTITGKGKLTVDAVSGGIANRYDSTLTIKDADIYITAPYALTGPSVDKAFEKLVVINSNLDLVSQNAAISDFNYGIVLNDCKIVTPAGAVIGEGYAVYESDGETLAKIVKIEKAGSKALKGDVTGDGKVDVSDITKIAAHIKGKRLLSGDMLLRADVNGDGKIDVSDITKIAAHIKGKRLLW